MSDPGEFRHLLQSLPPELRTSIAEAARSGLRALQRETPVSLPRWAHRHFYLSAESSQREEQWRAWPLQIGVLFCMGDDNVTEFTWYKSARVGATKCMLADIAYTAEHQRRNQGLWLPKDGDRDDFVKTDLDPMLRDVRIMRRVFPKTLEKSKDNTLQQKRFLGSLLKLRGGTASGNYRRLTLAKARADELDGFDQDIEGAGTPDALIHKRVEGATRPKEIYTSTGRKKGLSHIERRYNAADVRMRFRIDCPHCGEDHPLEWGGPKVKFGFKWDMEDPEGTVRHHCPHCHGAIRQADYLRQAKTGRWVSECGRYELRHWWDENGEPDAQFTVADGTPCLPPAKVAFHTWTAYSEQPGVTWGGILREFLDAVKAQKAGNKAPMVSWVNETKGETYEESGESADVNALQTRARHSGYTCGFVPEGCLLLAAGVDVQNDRFEIVVWGAGRHEQTWCIDYIVLDANPALMSEWDRLWERLQLQYRHAAGGWISLSGAAVDTGHFTHQAYAFEAKYRNASDSFRLYAVKGSSQEGDPIKARAAKWMDINLHGRTHKRGAKLWMVGVDTAKDLFYGRLKVPEPGPGYVHFAADLPAEFFRQYGNEKCLRVKVNGQFRQRWVHMQGANEVVDCTDYALFVFEALEVSKFDEKRWRGLEIKVAPNLFDMSDMPAPVPAPLPTPEVPPPGRAIEPQLPPNTRKPPQKPVTPAIKKPAAPPAPTGFASEAWLARDRSA